MSAVIYRYEPVAMKSPSLAGVRVSGGVSARVARRQGESRVVDVSERDGYKLRFPRRAAPPEAVIINTGGGLAGGDDVVQDFTVADDAALTVTSQASERAYRALGDAVTRVDVRAEVGENAHFAWLPQETIVYDGANLARTISLDIRATSHLLLAETVVFGRTAMGETVTGGTFRDTWRIRRDGRLVFAENVRLSEATFRSMSASAISGGAHIVTTNVYVAPDAEDRLAPVRRVLAESDFECAASAWNGLLVVRGLARSGEDVREMLAALLPAIGGPPLPRVWRT